MVYGRFNFTRGIRAGKTLILGPEGQATIGRLKSNDLPIGEPSVSSRHCQLTGTGETFEIEDIGSRNGTFVNGQRVTERTALAPGDVIRLGRSELTYGAFETMEAAEAAGLESESSTVAPLLGMADDSDASEMRPVAMADPPMLGTTTDDALPPVPEEEANLLGRIALYNRLLTSSQLEVCLLRAEQGGRKLGEVLLESGFIDKENLELLLRIQTGAHLKGEQEAKAREKDEELVKLALEKGWLHKEQLKHARQIQQKALRNGLETSLKDILVKKHYLKPDYVHHLQKMQAGESVMAVEIPGYDSYELLGCGGMGTVYKARQISMDRPVAIKVLAERCRDNPKYRERFLNEARSVARLNHENIIAGYDFGETDGVSYFVMEFVEGLSLQGHLQDTSRLPEREAADIALQVARALNHACEKKMIHRDIKPENILITNEDFKAKLCDLGLAWSGDDFDSAGRGFGTPNYMSPEQIRGKDLDIRTDIYSLGVTFYRMLFGKLPFRGNTAAETMTMHLKKTLEFPDDTMSPLTRQLSSVIGKMLAKQADKRYQTPKELVAELELLLEQEAAPAASVVPAPKSPLADESTGDKSSQRIKRRRRRRRR